MLKPPDCLHCKFHEVNNKIKGRIKCTHPKAEVFIDPAGIDRGQVHFPGSFSAAFIMDCKSFEHE